MKKLLSVFILLAILATCITGCSADNQTKSDVSSQNSSLEPSSSSNEIDPFVFTQESVATNEMTSDKYSTFYEIGTTTMVIPGLSQYFVPQGIDCWEEQDWMIISGYFDSGINSILFIIDMNTGEMLKYIKLQNTDGTDYTGHAGGVAVTEKNLFIANDTFLFRIELSDIEQAQSGDALAFADQIYTPTRASLCNYSDGILWVGDFYYGTDYPTDDFRHMQNRDGDEYRAWVVGYNLDTGSENEISATSYGTGNDYATPDYILSIRERIQGMTVVSDEYIALSESYGRKKDSNLYFYNNPLAEEPHSYYEMNGVSVPLWYLDDVQGYETLVSPPMTEGITAVDGNLYVLFESGADKYMNGDTRAVNPMDSIWLLDMLKLQ